MKKLFYTMSLATLLIASKAFACDKCQKFKNDNFFIVSTSANYNTNLKQVVMSIQVKGQAGVTMPDSIGKLDGAGVLGYVFPTTLKPEDVGFNQTEGIVALALTSHPDFDDSPLWDENNNGVFSDDGRVWHPHWVILVKDERVKGGLAVKEFKKEDKNVKLPPTAPNMPMYMDSPGFQVVTKGNTIQVVIPSYRINNKNDFKFDAVTCYMSVNTSDMMMPMLGVMDVYSVASGKLTLPYTIKIK
ncbi:MAG: hypothetical protein Q7W45_08885 [Bacteroidota bacterium]|nr:hypothetical protein [Bacteroidota bacterium]MDP3144208.1 hypothetical protein [Bacteroidota bacterium]